MRIAGIALGIVLAVIPVSVQAADARQIAQQGWSNFERGVAAALETVEAFRLDVFERTSAQRDAAKAEQERTRLRASAAARGEEDLDALLDAQGRPRIEGVEDSSGILSGWTTQAFSVIAYIFGSVLIFYGILFVILALLLRFVWVRVFRA